MIQSVNLMARFGGLAERWERRHGKIILVAVLLVCCQSAVRAEDLSIYPPMAAFALAEPPDPPGPGGVKMYSETAANPQWFIAQWNIAGGKLSPFKTTSDSGVTTSIASASEATVSISQGSDYVGYKLMQDGGVLPCLGESGRPRESDLFMSAQPKDAINLPLSRVKSLVQTINIKVEDGAPATGKGCATNKSGALVALILTNFTAPKPQTLFYQLSLHTNCRRQDDSACPAPPRHANYFFTKGPFGVDDFITELGESWILNGQSRSTNLNLLPRLEKLIRTGPPSMDQTPSHWTITGAYHGQHIWGDVTLATTWRDYKLVATLR